MYLPNVPGAMTIPESRVAALIFSGGFRLVWAEIQCTVHVNLSKWPINQLKPVHSSRQQLIRTYCSNVYTIATEAIGSGDLSRAQI